MVLIVFILILSVLVLVHEFGHFFVAKKLGIRVEEFGLGIPPRIFSKKIGETIYSLNLLPFGGFVKVAGEEPDADSALNVVAANDPGSFANKTPGQRVLVLVAGVFMNMVLAVLLFYFVLAANGFRTQYIPLLFDHQFKFGQTRVLGAVVTGVMDNSAAQKAGIQLGEAVVTIDGIQINGIADLRNSLKNKLGQTVTVKLMDVRNDYNGPTRELKMQPQTDDKGNVILGVYVSKAVSIVYATPAQRTFSGFLHSYNVLDFSLGTFGQLFKLAYTERSISPVSESVAGPVGIYQLVGGLISYGGSKVIFRLLDFVALMSVSLAFINILPLPSLDGGRIFFVIVEKIKGKPVSPVFEARLHQIGFVLLLGLLVLITVKDVLH